MPPLRKHPKDALTENQEKVLKFVMEAIKTTGKPPTLREISEHFQYASHQAAKEHLLALERKGYVRYQAYQARGIELLPKALILPVMGIGSTGFPILSEADISEELTPILDLRTRYKDLFVIRARGDSMIQAGIFDGDYVVVAKNISPKNGAIIAALVDGLITIKRLVKKNATVELHPENPRYPPIPLEGKANAVVGVVVAIYRKLFS